MQPEHFVADTKAKQLSEWADTVIKQQEEMKKYVQALQEECRYVEKWCGIVRESEKQHVEQVAAWEKTGEAGKPPTNEMQMDILRYYLKKTTVITTKSGSVVHLKHSHNYKCNFDPEARDEQGRRKCFTWQVCQHCCGDDRFLQHWNARFWQAPLTPGVEADRPEESRAVRVDDDANWPTPPWKGKGKGDGKGKGFGMKGDWNKGG